MGQSQQTLTAGMGIFECIGRSLLFSSHKQRWFKQRCLMWICDLTDNMFSNYDSLQDNGADLE
eukprot:scaffold24561_cov64-Attheya_sp.AAC.3